MKFSLISAAVAVALITGAAGSANAATMHGAMKPAVVKTTAMKHEASKDGVFVTGKIERVSAKAHWIVVGSHAYRYSPKLATLKLTKGETVKVTYRIVKGHRWATAISVV